MPVLDADSLAKLEALGRVVPFDEKRVLAHRDQWSLQILDENDGNRARFWIDVTTQKAAYENFGVKIQKDGVDIIVVKQVPLVPDLSRFKGSSIVKYLQSLARHVDQLRREAEAMVACRGPRVVELLCAHPFVYHASLGRGLAIEMECLVLCMPFFSQGDLFSFYCSGMKDLPQEERSSLVLSHAKMLAEAVCTVHEAGYIHRDIKPENCFVENGQLFLGDFGYAIRDEEADAAGCEGTLIYMAPEVARMHYAYEAQLATLATKLKSPLASAKKRAEKTRPHVARESDVFSLGATIHNVAAMSSLTNAGEDVIVAHMGLSLQASAILTLNEKKIPESLFPVVTKMLKRDPKERPSARAALELMNAV